MAGALTLNLGWDLLLASLAAGAAGALAAGLIGIPALRIRGLLLAVTTLAFALATSSFLLNSDYMPWLPEGRIDRLPLLGSIRVDSEAAFYYVSLAGLLVEPQLDAPQHGNISIILLAQRMLHGDRSSAMFRLKIDDEMAELLLSLNARQLAKLARTNQLLCHFGHDSAERLRQVTHNQREQGLSHFHASLLMACRPGALAVGA